MNDLRETMGVYKWWHGLVGLSLFVLCLVLSIRYAYSLAIGFSSGVMCVLGLILYCERKAGFEVSKSAIFHIREMVRGAWEGKLLFAIVALMGVNIAVWLASGVVAQMIVSGIDLAKNFNFLALSFVLMAVLSFMMGTALGAVSTMGIALLGIGVGLGFSKPILLGAIISGAYIADRMSPLSGLVNLTMSTLKVSFSSFLKESLRTLIPSFVVTLGLYLLQTPNGVGDPTQRIIWIREGLSNGFNLNILLLIVPVMMVVMATRGMPILVCMGTSVVLSSIACIVLQGFGVFELLNCWMTGFSLNTGTPEIDALIQGGGLFPMIEIVMIIVFALALSRLLSESGILLPLAEKMVKYAKNSFGVMVGIATSSAFFTTVACDQSLGILIPPLLYGKEAENQGIEPVKVARIVADTGTIIAPIEFWNLNAIVILSITGVSAVAYAPYAYFCWLLPAITLIEAFAFSKKK